MKIPFFIVSHKNKPVSNPANSRVKQYLQSLEHVAMGNCGIMFWPSHSIQLLIELHASLSSGCYGYPTWAEMNQQPRFTHGITDLLHRRRSCNFKALRYKVIFAQMPYNNDEHIMFTNAALPRVETASSIRFVIVEASELLQVKTDRG